MSLKWIIALPLSLASICPLQNHQVCNVLNSEHHHHSDNQHQCTCAITAASDRPAPEQSCTNFIEREDGTFPVISLTFNLKESPDIDEFPEESFRYTIAGALRVDPADVLLLRVNCQGTEDFLTVQFGVLRKFAAKQTKAQKKAKKFVDDDDSDDYYDDDDVNQMKQRKKVKNNEDDDSDAEPEDDGYENIKYDATMFVDAESVAARMKAMGHLSQIADLQVDSIEFTEDIIDLEYKPDNSTLIVQAIAVVVTIALMMLLGIWATCRNSDYSDDLQKI